jgi:lipopolysaccharide export system permease protein
VLKKLDILIIRAFAGPFIATFLISLFVLVMQFFWLYIDDLVGKGLDVTTILQFIWYVSLTLVPLALPLALLLSSIMTFGNLGESFELVAIKSAGISLTRFMRPLFMVTLGLSGIAFIFSNNIIPVANLKMSRLKYDIIVTKPAFDIKPGIFYNKIDGFVIKLGSKTQDSLIKDVVIFERNYSLQDNIITAKSGVMRVSADKRFLEFFLQDGWRYTEKGNRGTTNTEYTRLGFKSYKKVMDLSSFKMNKTEDSLFKYDPKMLSVRQIHEAVDSLHAKSKDYGKRSQKELAPYLTFVRYLDSNVVVGKPQQQLKKFDDYLPDSLRTIINDRTASQLNAVKSTIDQLALEYANREDTLKKHWIEWHRKFTLSVACLVLFIIGAPLGSIIRKGGLGMPLIFAIVFFVIFYLLNTFGEKFAKEDVLSPLGGMWLSTTILTPIGIFLTYKALRDSQLFNNEFYYRTFKGIRVRFAQWRQRKQATA